jgi:hypothetical protein
MPTTPENMNMARQPKASLSKPPIRGATIGATTSAVIM